MKFYYSKYPRQPYKFDFPKRKMQRSLERTRAFIEYMGRPGYTGEPWTQLIEVDGDTHRVLAEYETGGGWTDPLTAAGFVSR